MTDPCFPRGLRNARELGTDRKWDGLVADLELRLEAVAMRLLGRIGAKGLTPEECRDRIRV